MNVIDGRAEKKNEMILSDRCSKKNKKAPKLVGTKHKARRTDDWCDSHPVQTVHQLWLCRFLVLAEAGTLWMETEEVEPGWGRVTDGGNKWLCTSSLAISYTQTLLILIHMQACQLIYFHLPSRVRKFGQVTKSTKRTCPWAVRFWLLSFSLFFFHFLSVAALLFFFFYHQPISVFPSDILISENTAIFCSAHAALSLLTNGVSSGFFFSLWPWWDFVWVDFYMPFIQKETSLSSK